jgi:broad specificity phosphatase PhoE
LYRDLPLTENGSGQAYQLGAALTGRILEDMNLNPKIAAVYSSPFLRCRQNAASIIQGASSSGNFDTNDDKSVDCDDQKKIANQLKVKVENGLAESINENWYRSWCINGTDGTWGYKRKEIPDLDPDKVHMDSRALQPVETLLNWKECPTDTADGIVNDMMDNNHQSRTSLGGAYSLAGGNRPNLDRPNLESFCTQRDRMAKTINLLSDEHSLDGNDDETIVLTSHGGPVTHLYESLNGNDWTEHGEGSYCCFSIYQKVEEDSTSDNNDGNKWTPLVVNRVLWDSNTNSTITTGSNR